MKPNWLDHVEYTFNPKRLDTLKEDAKRFIGQRIKGQVQDFIEDGIFAGQRRIGFGYYSTDFDEPPASFFWVPEEDCDDIVLVESPLKEFFENKQ